MTDWQYYKQFVDKESDYSWDREGQTFEKILNDELSFDVTVAGNIIQRLQARHYDQDQAAMGEESEFDDEAKYELKDIDDEKWADIWRRFGEILKNRSRYFSPEAIDILDSIFKGIDLFQTWRGRTVIATIGPGKKIDSLYRARVFQSRKKLLEALCRPDLEIGPPPAAYAMSGRMNARGIAVFYGTTEPQVAMAEVRPPVGSNVAIARFKIDRHLKVLDLRALSNIVMDVSIFDPLYTYQMGKAKFLRKLGARITAPVMPDDELFDYLPTQAVADYLGAQTGIILDGIIYPSAQVAGEEINIVLFHKAARVNELVLPEAIEINATDVNYDDDGPYLHYQVTELLTRRKKALTPLIEDNEPIDDRYPALTIDIESLCVHAVNSVNYNTQEYYVSRQRIKKPGKMKPIDFDF
ncbi:RES family NAD+ phosphorylase [Mucilaginibacter angelicae]